MRRAFAAVRTIRPGGALWGLPAMLLFLPGAARAQELYGCNNAGRLFVLNLATGAGTPVCNLPTHPDPGATEIEYDGAHNVAFVQARDGVFGGQMFDILNCMGVGPLLSTNDLVFNGLEFVGGLLYGTAIPGPCQPSHLAILDPTSGLSTAIGPTGKGPISGLAWDPQTQTLYGVTGCSQQMGPSQLVRVDLATGAAVDVGSTGRTLGSLEFGPDARLYAGGDNTDGGKLYVIDPTNGSSTLVGPTGYANVTGLALITRPVPVLISGFAATPFEGGVKLAWEIYSDEQVLGFRIYRRLAGASVGEGIPADGLIPGESRTYTDASVQGGKSYDYTLAVVLTDRELVSPVIRAEAMAYTVALHQNTPNPFNPSTTISFTLAEREVVTLSIYDVEGKRVRTLVDGTVGEGRHEYIWNGRDARGGSVGSGVYFCRLTAGKQSVSRKMVLLK